MQPTKSLKPSPDFSGTTPRHFNSPTIPTFRSDNFFIGIPGAAALSPEMEDSIRSVETIIGYSFRRKTLLEEALTHSSFSENLNYERLEFFGDAILGLATSNHLFHVYPNLDPGELTLLRAANVSTERLARVALRRGFIRYMRHNAPSLLDKFAEVVSEEDDLVTYGGSMKAPRILADIVESIAAAVYVDVDYNIHIFWGGKEAVIKHCQKGGKSQANVYVDGKFIATAVSGQKDIARLNAAKAALPVLANSDQNLCADIDVPFEIKGAKQKLHEICGRIKWHGPVYRGPPHKKKFICSVRIVTEEGILCMEGEEKSRRKEAEFCSLHDDTGLRNC